MEKLFNPREVGRTRAFSGPSCPFPRHSKKDDMVTDGEIVWQNSGRAMPSVPERMKHLPVRRGFVVPAFVQWVKDEPEFRAMNPQHFLRCVRERLCWICGQILKGSANNPFVVGPMCTVNRISAEPPSHVECARYSAMVCPFLSRPQMDRRRNDDIAIRDAPGIMIKRNPGVVALWFARDYMTFNIDHGMLFSMGAPSGVEWYREGRAATRAEVAEAYDSGIPVILDAAAKDGPEEVKRIEVRIERARRYFPKR